jgi:hypothetical protein
LALLVTLALRRAESEIAGGTAPNAALTDGYVLAFQVAAGLLVVAGIMAALLLEHVPVTSEHGEGTDEKAAEKAAVHTH